MLTRPCSLTCIFTARLSASCRTHAPGAYVLAADELLSPRKPRPQGPFLRQNATRTLTSVPTLRTDSSRHARTVQAGHIDPRSGAGQAIRSLSVSRLTNRRDIACDLPADYLRAQVPGRRCPRCMQICHLCTRLNWCR
jgi:hypothetical protein